MLLQTQTQSYILTHVDLFEFHSNPPASSYGIFFAMTDLALISPHPAVRVGTRDLQFQRKVPVQLCTCNFQGSKVCGQFSQERNQM
jgi:hypothetical protein